MEIGCTLGWCVLRNGTLEHEASNLQRRIRFAQLSYVGSPLLQAEFVLGERAIQCRKNRLRIGRQASAFILKNQPGISFLLAGNDLADYHRRPSSDRLLDRCAS